MAPAGGRRYLTEEEKSRIEALGSDKLFETLKERLREQKGRHQGGSKWIGTGGTSPFGAYGYNPEGIRIGQDGTRNFRAVKVWDSATSRTSTTTVELGVRNMRLALRRLRRFARTGAPDELDLDGTIHETATRATSTEAAPRAAQRRQGAAVPRRRRLDGLARREGRGAVLRGATSSSTSSTSTSTTAFTSVSGRRTAAGTPRLRRPST